MSSDTNVREGTRRVTRIASFLGAGIGVMIASQSASDMVDFVAFATFGGLVGFVIPIVVQKASWYIADGFRKNSDGQ